MKITVIALCFAMVLGAPAYNLLLLDDSSPDYGMPDNYRNLDNVENILTSMGIGFDHVHNNWILNKTSDFQFLQEYNIILWYNDNRAISQSEYGAMQQWVGDGNCLVVTGEDSLGSPNDPLMAELVGSTIYGDYPFCTSFNITRPGSWITDGDAGYYDGTYPLLDYTSDQDKAAPKAPGTYAVAVDLIGDRTLGPAKILVTEDVKPRGGIVIYWNGNRDAAEWWRLSQTPETVNMFKNMMYYLTQASAVESVSWGGIKNVFAP
jgi:hypothetical protein